jgi:type I restriction enzyme S subunit
MSEWSYTTLGDLVRQDRKITYGIVQPGPDISPDGIPLIRGKDYSSGKVSREGLYHVKPEIAATYSRSKVLGGDLLLSIAGYVGQTAIVPLELEGANLTQTTARLSIDSKKGDPTFVFYSINSQEFSSEVDRYTKGSAQSGLNLGDVEKFKLLAPTSLPEQRKIAKILSTVDNLIEKTQALIDKYQSIKQGMMHDLFTRGVDKNGHLRPSYEEAPHLYKESELGWIPEEWECGRLGDDIEGIKSGWSPICDAFTASPDEWAILKTTAVVWDGYCETEQKRLPYNLTPLSSIEVKKDDILVTRKGPVERVGVVVHVKDTRSKLMFPDTVFRLRVKRESTLLPAFLPLTLESEVVQKNWFGRKIGLADAQVNINHTIVKNTSFPKPSMHEQKRIMRIIDSSKCRLRTENRALEKLILLKSGLMQDLLTGKVRVRVDP